MRLDQEGSATRLAFIQHDALRQEEEKQESDIEAKVPKHFLEEEESLPCSLLSKDFNNSGNVVAAVLVIAYNRPAYLKRTLNTLEKRLRARSVAEKFPIFVSQVSQPRIDATPPYSILKQRSTDRQTDTHR